MTTLVRPNREWKFWARVGSHFKACANCGSGDVFRAYHPTTAGFSHYCFTCSAIDEDCWPTPEPRQRKALDPNGPLTPGQKTALTRARRKLDPSYQPQPKVRPSYDPDDPNLTPAQKAALTRLRRRLAALEAA
jgi:hypothetical protein